MYPVSGAFLEAVKQNTRRYYWTGRITTKAGRVYEFAPEDIVKGSGYISNKCCGDTEIELGSIYAAELGISLILDVDRYTLYDAIVEPFYHLRLLDGSYETVPMGVYEVAEANRMKHFLELKAYDYMVRFEKSFSNFSMKGTPYDMVAYCCRACNVSMAQTQLQYAEMTNGNVSLFIYPDNDIETYRDILFYVAQVLGGYFTINRAGLLELRKFRTAAVMSFEQKHRFTSSFADYVTRFTAVSSTNSQTQIAEYYALDVDDGLTMNLGVNPLIQSPLEANRRTICRNILNDIAVIRYVPFESEMIGNPALDLGDVLQFTGGQADGTQISCITSINCRINGKQTLKCVGGNPRLAQSKSKNDKNIAGLVNQIEEKKYSIQTVTNAAQINVGSERVEIARFEFASTENTYAQFLGQVVVDADGDGGLTVVKVTYELNGNEVLTFYPYETWCDGKHMLALFYPLADLQPNVTNRFRVYLQAQSGGGTIAQGNVIASICGQSMAAMAEWDGKIDVEQQAGRFLFAENPLYMKACRDAESIRLA